MLWYFVDVIDWILDNLIDKTRSRRGVLKKMKELGLMFKAPTKKTAAAAANKNQWEEEEDEELRSLYDQYRVEENCLERIISEFEERRNKQQIIKRMLQLHIIADKSEILPKKSSKPKSKKNIKQLDLSDEDEYMEEPVFDVLKNGTSSKIKKIKRIRKPAQPVKGNILRTPMDMGTIRSLVAQVNNEEHVEAIEWLKECLTDAAEDSEDQDPSDESDGVPLLPLTEKQKEAMENSDFKKVLLTFGIQPPITGMEAYWRIPTYLSAGDLKLRIDILDGIEIEEQAVDFFESQNPMESSDDEDANEESESEEDYLDNLQRVKPSQMLSKKIPNSIIETEEDAAETSLILKRLQHQNRKPYDSSSEEENASEVEQKTTEEQSRHVNELFDQLKAKRANKKPFVEKEHENKHEISKVESESDDEDKRFIEKKLKLKKRRPIISSDDDDDDDDDDAEDEDKEHHRKAEKIQEQQDRNEVENEEEKNTIISEIDKTEEAENIGVNNKRQRSPSTIHNLSIDATLTDCNTRMKKQRLSNLNESDNDE